METIDILVSEKTRELSKNGSNLFLTWTFPTNHLHQQQSIGVSYFVIWVGETGKELLRSVCFGPTEMIPEMLSKVSETELKDVLGK